MVKVDKYALIRRAHLVDKMSIRELARTFHHSKRKIREILREPEPKPYQRRAMPSVLDSFKAVIDEILRADEEAPRKQRHTAAKIFRRLRDEHAYGGGYDRVRRYIGSKGRSQRETFIPLDHDPGQRLECDFGHIHVDFPDGRRLVPVLMMTWAYSNCPFAIALPTERTEAILHGMVEAFAFFGCVPREVWWDNPKTVAPQLFAGRERRLNERYLALSSHYAFEPLFCMVREPQEKPRVEGRVRHLQRDWATPVPRTQDRAELNVHLRACCMRDRDRIQQGQTETIGQRFARETIVEASRSLPTGQFDPCISEPAKVDKYQTARFETNRYSAPRSAAFQAVTVKAYVERIDIVLGSQVIAAHPRCYGKNEQILDPHHYLDTLRRRPAALDHANVFRRWHLPALFSELRTALEKQHGERRGAKHFVRVLHLLDEHPIELVQRAIEMSRGATGYDVESILLRVRRQRPDNTPTPLERSQQPELVRDVNVPPPDLSKFNQFLSHGESDHEGSE
jgi:transposase